MSRSADRMMRRRGERIHPGHSSKLSREQLDQPALALLYGSARLGQGELLHAGIARGPRPGRTLCTDKQLFHHPIFARDPGFNVGLPAGERHLYALAALRLNHGSACQECIAQLVEIGGDGIYPYLNPTKAV